MEGPATLSLRCLSIPDHLIGASVRLHNRMPPPNKTTEKGTPGPDQEVPGGIHADQLASSAGRPDTSTASIKRASSNSANVRHDRYVYPHKPHSPRATEQPSTTSISATTASRSPSIERGVYREHHYIRTESQRERHTSTTSASGSVSQSTLHPDSDPQRHSSRHQRQPLRPTREGPQVRLPPPRTFEYKRIRVDPKKKGGGVRSRLA
uniref:Uncharacterized protein n=1 Tax=Caenorhabditis japonica TaxID=281687 RepID=A0A8R1EHS9_CAEJA